MKIPKNIFTILLLCLALTACTKSSEDKTKGPNPKFKDMVVIPAGEFIMGSSKYDESGKGNTMGTRKPFYADERPERKMIIKEFYIDKYEVTNKQFQKYVSTGQGEPPPSWNGTTFRAGREMYPVSGINWFQAFDYCEWAGKRLPTEIEWEKSARGSDGREFPWGNEFDTTDKKRGNIGNQEVKDLSAVGSFEDGKSVYGVYDTVGNVWEWVADWYKPYPGNADNLPDYGEQSRVLRGGGWGGGQGHYIIAHFFRSAHRFYARPYVAYPDVGFRCAASSD